MKEPLCALQIHPLDHLNRLSIHKYFCMGFALILIGFLPAMLSAATIDDLQFTLINGGTEYSVSAIDPSNIAGSLEIPATYNNKPVTEIGAYGFYQSSSLTSIALPDGLTTIRNNALRGTGLTEITIPATVTSIAYFAFTDCDDLSSFTFLGAAPTLGEGVFFDTALNVVGGFTITIYDTNEASYADWSDSLTFNVTPAPVVPVFLYAQTSYNPTTQALSIVTQNEPSAVTINLEQANSLSGTWSILSNTAYTQSNNADTGTVTRTITIDPAANANGFYRLASATESTQ